MEPTHQFQPASADDPTPAQTGPRVARPPERAVVACGVALLGAAVVLSTFYTRARGDIDWSNYAMGIAATAGLLGIALLAGLVVRDRDDWSDVVSWPGAFGAVGAGFMVGIAMNSNDAGPYVVGGVIVVISVLGYLLAHRAPFVVSAILGLGIIYIKLFTDVFNFGDGDNFALEISLGILVFTVVVTALGWVLPARAVTGVFVGVLAVIGNVTLLALIGIASSFAAAFGGSDRPGTNQLRFDKFDDDVWFVLGFAAVLVVIWALCSWWTGHVGFRLLIVAISVTVVPLAAAALAARHPTWWEVAVGAAGGLLLVGAVLLALRRRRTTAHEATAA
jgi:hypothetical protein